MKQRAYALRVKDGSWSAHPGMWSTTADARMLSFTLAVQRDEVSLGGHNIQAHFDAPGHDSHYAERPDVTLASGWTIRFRNQFADAPEVARAIIGSVSAELSDVTAEVEQARGAAMEELMKVLFARTFIATGPDYWR